MRFGILVTLSAAWCQLIPQGIAQQSPPSAVYREFLRELNLQLLQQFPPLEPVLPLTDLPEGLSDDESDGEESTLIKAHPVVSPVRQQKLKLMKEAIQLAALFERDVQLHSVIEHLAERLFPEWPRLIYFGTKVPKILEEALAQAQQLSRDKNNGTRKIENDLTSIARLRELESWNTRWIGIDQAGFSIDQFIRGRWYLDRISHDGGLSDDELRIIDNLYSDVSTGVRQARLNMEAGEFFKKLQNFSLPDNIQKLVQDQLADMKVEAEFPRRIWEAPIEIMARTEIFDNFEEFMRGAHDHRLLGSPALIDDLTHALEGMEVKKMPGGIPPMHEMGSRTKESLKRDVNNQIDALDAYYKLFISNRYLDMLSAISEPPKHVLERVRQAYVMADNLKKFRNRTINSAEMEELELINQELSRFGYTFDYEVDDVIHRTSVELLGMLDDLIGKGGSKELRARLRQDVFEKLQASPSSPQTRDPIGHEGSPFDVVGRRQSNVEDHHSNRTNRRPLNRRISSAMASVSRRIRSNMAGQYARLE